MNQKIYPYLFLTPCLLIILAITIYPLFYTLGLSFLHWEITIPDPIFIGFKNYIELITDDIRFIHSIYVTILIVSAEVIIEFVLGLFFATLLWRDLPGKKVFVAALILPVLVIPVVSGYTWKLLWDAEYGPINQIIGLIIGESFTFPWLGQTNTAIFAIVITLIWQWTPFMAIILLAGLSSLSDDILDASSVDGANLWQQFRWVTLPMMRPIIVVALLIRTLDAYKIFDVVYTLTGGAPGSSTETVSLYIYTEAYRNFRLGYGAAASFILMIFIVIVLNIFQRYLENE